ncbi:thioredoxin family protein [Candidatus Saccharibacteria bacterium]|nr:MAG: thioredoxin family protein [Candidatus Saccharibacteria bacterium]
MKAKYTVGIVAAVAAIGAAIILIQQRPAQAPHKVLSPSTNTTVTPIATTTPAPGRYTDYSPEAMSAPNYTETILFFHAPWCPECRAYNSVLTTTPPPTGVQILKVDHDSSTDLRKQYGVVVQTTFVRITPAGEKISVWPAYGKEKSIQAILDNT